MRGQKRVASAGLLAVAVAGSVIGSGAAAASQSAVVGHVYVNDQPLRDDYVPLEFRSHDDLPTQVIQQGYYFVMGDHRNNSSDSRHWGMVPKKYIIGKVQLRWWPVPTARVF